MNVTELFARLGYSHEQAVTVYRDQVVRLEAKVAAAAVATEHGKGGPAGKRYDGKFYHQLVAQLDGARQTLAAVEGK
jgi:hypothetical protein